MEDQIQSMRRELVSARRRIENVVTERAADRVAYAAELSAIRLQFVALEGRLKSMEEGLVRIMSHSTWLLRLLAGGIVLALTQFVLEGGLSHAG